MRNLQVTSYKLRFTSYELQATSYTLHGGRVRNRTELEIAPRQHRLDVRREGVPPAAVDGGREDRVEAVGVCGSYKLRFTSRSRWCLWKLNVTSYE